MDRRSVLVPLPPLDWGGLQTFAVNIDEGLKDAGWNWTVVVPPEAKTVIERLSDNGVDVLTMPLPRLQRSPAASLRALASMRGSVRAIAQSPQGRAARLVQAVGAHHPHGYMLSRTMAKPLVWQLHSNILPAPARGLVSRFIDAKADAIMTNGTSVAKAFWGQRPIPNHYVFYAPVDTERFAPSPIERERRRTEVGFQPDKIVVGTVGNRGWQKNHELLIAAASDIVERNSKVRFLILGAPVASYEETYRTQVLEVADRINAQRPGAITFLSPGNTIDSWIHSIDVFVLSSHAEGVPISLFEAMAAEKPVVSARVGSIDEIVVDNETGYTFSPGDKDTFVHHLERLTQDQPLREGMGRASRARIVSTFALDSVVRQHVAAYEHALHAAHG